MQLCSSKATVIASLEIKGGLFVRCFLFQLFANLFNSLLVGRIRSHVDSLDLSNQAAKIIEFVTKDNVPDPQNSKIANSFYL